MRPLALASILMRRSPVKSVSLVLLLVVSIVVFALVSELSRVSQSGLDSAIEKDQGLRGSYSVTLDRALQMSAQEEFGVAEAAASDAGFHVWGYAEDLPTITSECPPFESVGPQSMRVLWQAPGVARDLPFGDTGALQTSWCLDGQEIPASALYLPDADMQAVLGSRLYLNSQYRDVVLLSTTQPTARSYIVVTGNDSDASAALADSVMRLVETRAHAVDIDASAAVVVARLDSAGANVRSASNGIALVYNIIRWGVLTLAGLGLLVVQLLAVRQRSWFYGLARAIGARPRAIGALLAGETIAVLVAALAISVGVLALTQGLVAGFAYQAFQVEAHVLTASTLRTLAWGLAGVLAIATGIPTIAVLRRDPIDVLEAPRD